jgi:hypothetical protein
MPAGAAILPMRVRAGFSMSTSVWFYQGRIVMHSSRRSAANPIHPTSGRGFETASPSLRLILDDQND